jgi:hypothetical protein
MKSLIGSEKQINWAEELRHSRLSEIERVKAEALKNMDRGGKSALPIIEKIKNYYESIESAHYWIEQKNDSFTEIRKLVGVAVKGQLDQYQVKSVGYIEDLIKYLKEN